MTETFGEFLAYIDILELRKELKTEVEAELIIKPKQKCEKLHVSFFFMQI